MRKQPSKHFRNRCTRSLPPTILSTRITSRCPLLSIIGPHHLLGQRSWHSDNLLRLLAGLVQLSAAIGRSIRRFLPIVSLRESHNTPLSSAYCTCSDRTVKCSVVLHDNLSPQAPPLSARSFPHRTSVPVERRAFFISNVRHVKRAHFDNI